MKLDKIILELKNIRDTKDIIKCDELIKELEKELKEKCFKEKPSDKKRLSAIKRVLKSSKERPILECFTPYETGKCAFTDSYEMFIINESCLPFDVAFASNVNDDFKDNYLRVNANKILGKKDGVYPNLHNLIPTTEPLYKINLKVSDILALEKTTEKKNGAKVYTIKNENGKISFNLSYLKNCIDILKLKDIVTLEIYGELSPIIIHNDKQEVGLIVPIRTF